MQNETSDFLSIFIDDQFLSSEENIITEVKKIAKFYDIHERHQYNEVSRYVDKELEESQDTVEYMLNNIHGLLTILKLNPERYDINIAEVTEKFKEKDIIQKLEKLYDHIALEESRIINNSRMISLAGQKIREEVISNFNDISSSYEKKLDDIGNAQSANTITVVGIFAAIIFVFFGGIDSLANIFDGVFNLKTKKELILPIIAILFIGVVLFNIIFLLLYSISKMTNKSIGRTINWKYPKSYDVERINEYCHQVYCYESEFRKCFRSEEKAEKCRSRKTRRSRFITSISNGLQILFLRYPYLIFINFIMIGTVLILYLIY